MLLDRTITQLDIGPMPPDEARRMGQLGYLQWLSGAPNDVDYRGIAAQALERATPFQYRSPAVEAFCDLLAESIAAPLKPLPFMPVERCRRGGAQAQRQRRLAL